jgi:hypothetical protein
MQRVFRAFLIWFVAFAIPLQGYAAAAMISCGPMHATTASASAEDPSQHAGHSGDARHGAIDAAAEPHGDADVDHGKAVKIGCAACAACCTASFAPSAVVPFTGVIHSHAVEIPFFGRSGDGFVPDGLERPPRTSLA